MAFDLGLVEDAYTAALSNPQHDLAEEKLRRLVLALVEQGGCPAPGPLCWRLHQDQAGYNVVPGTLLA